MARFAEPLIAYFLPVAGKLTYAQLAELNKLPSPAKPVRRLNVTRERMRAHRANSGHLLEFGNFPKFLSGLPDAFKLLVDLAADRLYKRKLCLQFFPHQLRGELADNPGGIAVVSGRYGGIHAPVPQTVAQLPLMDRHGFDQSLVFFYLAIKQPPYPQVLRGPNRFKGSQPEQPA